MTSESVISHVYMFCSIPHPSLVEFGATLGVRGVIIDDEKFHASPEVVQSMCLAAEKWGLDTLMRLRIASSERVEYALNLGIGTVLLPRLTTVEQIPPLCSSLAWPPHGTRGYGGSRATLFNIGKHERKPQAQVIVETPELLEKVEEVAALKSVGGLDIGMLDLAAALRVPPELSNGTLGAAIDRVIRAANAAGKPVGMTMPNLRTAREWGHRGLTHFVMDPLAMLRHFVKEDLRSLEGSST
ncbi:MAG: aldolase/citrate lyase family protein [Hyphomicrobiaceae bacterium]